MPLDPKPVLGLLREIAEYLTTHKKSSYILELLGRPYTPIHINEPSSTPPLVHKYFDIATANATIAEPALQKIIANIEELIPQLRWYKRSDDESSAEFSDGHFNSIIVGQSGLVSIDGLLIGLTLMAPGVTFPIHRHPPEELYISLSLGEWWREGQEWWSPGLGGVVYNACNQLHSMRSGPEPHLSLWMLFGEAHVST